MEVKEASAVYLRSTRYKHTEVGAIPEDWNTVSLENVALTGGLVRGPFGGTLKKEFFVESGYKVYEQRNAIYQTIEKGHYFIDLSKFKELERFRVRPGDLIVSCSGTIGCIYQIPNEAPEGVVNQALLKISLDDEKVDDGFFLAVFRSKSFQERIKENSHGGAMQNLVGMGTFRKTLFQLPPTKAEQEAIAEALSDADALVESLEQLLAKKCHLKQGAMQELLTGKKRLPGFSGEWEAKRLGELLEYEQPTKYLVKDSEYSDGNDVPVLTAGKTFILGYTDEENGIFNNLPAIIFDDFTTATKYVTFPFKAKSSAMKILKPRDAIVNVKLVFEVMQLIRFQLGDHKRYWISEYQNLEIKIPNAEEQTAIAAILSDMDAEIAELEAKLAKARNIRQGMMQELLTGRIRLV
jgi:type I restriction enzyme S subunit